MNLLRTEKLSFSYFPEKERELPLFQEMDLTVPEGEILCFLGPSGCGKTTLLKLLAGFVRPQKGQVFYADRAVTGPFKKGQMIFQDPSQLLPWLTVAQNVEFPLRRSLLKKSDGTSCRNVLEETGLWEYRNFYPSQLSGGMKQRCALARGLYARPDLLFMDEPFVSLDAPSRQGLQNLLLSLWKERKTTILFVTHDIAEALILSDRILLFSGSGKPPVLYHNSLPRPRVRQKEEFLKEESRFFSYLSSSERTL